MDRKERINSLNLAIQVALRGARADIWTALPGIIESFDAAACTATVQPTIQAKVQTKEGEVSDVNLPVLPDVPVCFPGAGPFAITFPIAAGDEGVIVFSARCIDAFWQNGGIQPQADLRMHDLSDAMFIPTRLSQTKKLENISTEALQVRSQDGAAYVELAAGGVINIKAPGGMNVEGNVAITGDLAVTGNIAATGTLTWATGEFAGGLATINSDLHVIGDSAADGAVSGSEVTAGGVGLTTHIHGGVETGGGSTQPPTVPP